MRSQGARCHYPGVHGVSGTPASRFAARAKTNSRSESRFTYLKHSWFTGPGISAKCDSARRTTDLATCSRAPLAWPPGRMKLLSGGRLDSISSIAASSLAVMAGVTLTESSSMSALEMSEPSTKRSSCIEARMERIRSFGPAAKAAPSTALASSMAPLERILGSAFDTRSPVRSPVVPASPVRVYIFTESAGTLIHIM